jgi:hypothetical protein
VADTAWTIGWSIFSFVAGAGISHVAAVFRDKRREFNEAARPFHDWIAIHLTRNEGYDDAPGPAARQALAARLNAKDGRLFLQLIPVIEREYRRAERKSISGSVLRERSVRAYNALQQLSALIELR